MSKIFTGRRVTDLFRGLLAALSDGVVERAGEEVGRGAAEAPAELLRELDSGHGLVAVVVGDEGLQAGAAVVGAAANRREYRINVYNFDTSLLNWNDFG